MAQYVATLGSALLGFLGYRLYVKIVEGRALSEFDQRHAAKEFSGGIVLGLFLFCVTVGVLATLGVFSITGRGQASDLVWPLASAVSAAVLEELLFRAVLFRLIEESLGTWIAVAVSAALFGLLHLLSPNPTALGIFAIVLEAGILLASAYVLTRRLWFPIGLHLAWNFAQGGIFGIAVSGTPSQGLLRAQLTGPEWLSGGTFGAEASIVSIALCLAASVTLFFVSSRRQPFHRPYWHRSVLAPVEQAV
jgi:hypothetical protein